MKTSLGKMAMVWFAVTALIAAPPVMGKDKENSAANETKAVKVEKANMKQVAYLGVAVEPLHPAFWTHLRDVLEHEQGLLVADVAKDSPAEKAGLKTHDILKSYGDQKLFSPGQLAALVHADKAGHQVKFGIVRAGTPQEVNVTLGEHAAPTVENAGRRPMWRMPRWFRSQRTPTDKTTGWESFDSMTLNSLGDNRYKVEIGYETKDGKIERRAFEGTREEIRQEIMAQKDLPANEREHLLRGLDTPGEDSQFDFPDIYLSPDGQMIWEFRDLNSEFQPTVPSSL